MLDQCGECLPFNHDARDACLGCDGVPNSGKVYGMTPYWRYRVLIYSADDCGICRFPTDTNFNNCSTCQEPTFVRPLLYRFRVISGL